MFEILILHKAKDMQETPESVREIDSNYNGEGMD
jgi:hypothetical protein